MELQAMPYGGNTPETHERLSKALNLPDQDIDNPQSLVGSDNIGTPVSDGAETSHDTLSGEMPAVITTSMVISLLNQINEGLNIDFKNLDISDVIDVIDSENEAFLRPSDAGDSPNSSPGSTSYAGSDFTNSLQPDEWRQRQVAAKSEHNHTFLVCGACGHILMAVLNVLRQAIREAKESDSDQQKIVASRKKHGGVLGFKELAARAELSPWHFHRVFRATTGITPKAYSEAVWEFLLNKYNIEDGGAISESTSSQSNPSSSDRSLSANSSANRSNKKTTSMAKMPHQHMPMQHMPHMHNSAMPPLNLPPGQGMLDYGLDSGYNNMSPTNPAAPTHLEEAFMNYEHTLPHPPNSRHRRHASESVYMPPMEMRGRSKSISRGSLATGRVEKPQSRTRFGYPVPAALSSFDAAEPVDQPRGRSRDKTSIPNARVGHLSAPLSALNRHGATSSERRSRPGSRQGRAGMQPLTPVLTSVGDQDPERDLYNEVMDQGSGGLNQGLFIDQLKGVDSMRSSPIPLHEPLISHTNPSQDSVIMETNNRISPTYHPSKMPNPELFDSSGMPPQRRQSHVQFQTPISQSNTIPSIQQPLYLDDELPLESMDPLETQSSANDFLGNGLGLNNDLAHDYSMKGGNQHADDLNLSGLNDDIWMQPPGNLSLSVDPHCTHEEHSKLQMPNLDSLSLHNFEFNNEEFMDGNDSWAPT